MCMIDGADPWDFAGEWREHRARIAHRCSECGREIAPGETYGTFWAIMDGLGMVYKQCVHCKAAVRWLKVVCSGWLCEGVLEDLEQHWDDGIEYRSVWLGRAIVGLRRKWQRKDGALMAPLPEPPASALRVAHA